MLWDAIARQRCEEGVGVYLVERFFPVEQDGVKCCPVASARSMSLRIMCMGCEVERVALNPYWVSLSLSSRAACSLECKSFAKSL